MATARKNDFTFDTSVLSWNVSASTFLTDNKKTDVWNGLATANIVFNSDGKILLVQRAAHDTKPGQWEVPGGAVDDEDVTILHAAARELYEEAGLTASRYIGIVGEGPGREFQQVMVGRHGDVWARFTFVTEVKDSNAVELDPNEHQDYMWATEDEIRTERSGDRAVPLTSRDVQLRLLEALRLRNEVS